MLIDNSDNDVINSTKTFRIYLSTIYLQNITYISVLLLLIDNNKMEIYFVLCKYLIEIIKVESNNLLDI